MHSMTVEAVRTGLIVPNETGQDLGFQAPELSQNFSKETIITAGVKLAGATIFTIGMYKAFTADNLTDFAVGAVLMYAGYQVFNSR